MAPPLKGILKRVAGKFFRSPRIKKLELRTGPHSGRYNTPHLRNEQFSGKIPSEQWQQQIWRDFTKKGGARDQFLDNVRHNATLTDLQAMGMTDVQAKHFLAGGALPREFQVHHVIPRKVGGGNEFDNLVLIRNGPDHKLLTAQQNAMLNKLKPGDSFDVRLPTVPPGVLTWPQSGMGAYIP